jgi:tRNA1(Val) A37 N6-methylase TrmN6
LLSDFSKPLKNKKVIELGTGIGAIPLLWCKENPPKHITAVEIQREAYDLFVKSINFNNLSKIITPINSDFLHLDKKVKFSSYDVVVCNPPYRELGTGKLSKANEMQIANHEIEATLKNIISTAKRLLVFGGKFYLCQRPQRICDVIFEMRNQNLEPKVLRFVHFKKDKAPKLFLIEGKYGGKPGMLVKPPLIIKDENDNYSKDMKQIYKDYLNKD